MKTVNLINATEQITNALSVLSKKDSIANSSRQENINDLFANTTMLAPSLPIENRIEALKLDEDELVVIPMLHLMDSAISEFISGKNDKFNVECELIKKDELRNEHHKCEFTFMHPIMGTLTVRITLVCYLDIDCWSWQESALLDAIEYTYKGNSSLGESSEALEHFITLYHDEFIQMAENVLNGSAEFDMYPSLDEINFAKETLSFYEPLINLSNDLAAKLK